MFEINEAFAAQSIAVVKELGLNADKVKLFFYFLHSASVSLRVALTRSSPATGERQRRRHLSRTSHRYVRLQGAGDPTARSPEGKGQKGRGLPVHRRRDGHRHVCGEGVRRASGVALGHHGNKGSLVYANEEIRISPVLSANCSWCK